MTASKRTAGGKGESRRQDLDITETETPLAGAFEAISLFSAATRSQRIIMALWAAHTYAYRSFPATPRLSFSADGRGMGKTVSMQVTTAMALNPLNAGYASQASVYNWLERHKDTTVGLDEADKIFGVTGRRTSRDVLRSVINDGYSTKGTVLVTRGGEAVQIPVFAPMALAGIGRLPDDTLDRAIEITMMRRLPPEQYLAELHDDQLSLIGRDLAGWLDNAVSVRWLKQWDAEHGHLADVKGDPRFRLVCAPLAAVAAYAGMHDQFLEAIGEIQSGLAVAPPPTLATLLLLDLRELWDDRDRMLSAAEVITLLRTHESRRWDDLGDGRLGEVALASLLGQSGIRSRTSHGTRGYRRSDVVPRGNASHSEPRNSGNAEKGTVDNDLPDADDIVEGEWKEAA